MAEVRFPGGSFRMAVAFTLPPESKDEADEEVWDEPLAALGCLAASRDEFTPSISSLPAALVRHFGEGAVG